MRSTRTCPLVLGFFGIEKQAKRNRLARFFFGFLNYFLNALIASSLPQKTHLPLTSTSSLSSA